MGDVGAQQVKLQMLVRTCGLITLLRVGMSSPLLAAEGQRPPRLAINVNLYPYLNRIKNDTDLTATINAARPGRFSYFSFTNYRGVFSSGDVRFDRTEQNLRWNISENVPIDLNLQAVMFGGDRDDHVQFGIGWRLNDTAFLKSFFDKLNLSYRLTFHLTQFSTAEKNFWQMEHWFRMTFPGISDRLYLSGFLDQTFGLERSDILPRHPIVAEIQLGMRLFDRFYAVTEYRNNDRRSAEPHNAAVGVKYKFRW